MADGTVAERLAAFAHGFRLEAAPAEIIDMAKLHLLDTIGCALAAAGSDYAERSFDAARRIDTGSGSVAIGQAETLGLDAAIRFNAGIAHMLDFDDTHRITLTHPSVSAAPLAFGLAAHLGTTGEDMLSAYLVAVETSCRAGLGAAGPAFLHRGVHPTGALCAFGCALGAGRLLGLSTEQMTHAQGIALSFASGPMEWQRDGAEAKRMHPGNAAAGGLMAASAAASGITGPRLPYEGRAGIYSLFLGEDTRTDTDAICAGLGEDWAFADVSIKPYPLVHHIHGAIDCALQLVRENGVRPDDIEQLTVHLADRQIPILAEPEETKRHPRNGYQGIFSAYHAVAAAMVRGRMTLDETMETLLDDPAIVALRDRIDIVADPDSLYPEYYSGRVTARLTSGRTVAHAEKFHPGSDRRPLPRNAALEKFRANASRLMDDRRVRLLEDAVLSLPALPADALAPLLSGGAHGG